MTDSAGGEGRSFEWSAVLGPPPSGWDCHQALAAAATVGPLRLEPIGVRMTEVVPIVTPPQLGGWHHKWTYPFRVRGVATLEGKGSAAPFLRPGFPREWSAVTAIAAVQLHRLRGLLAVGWESHWTVRDFPRPQDGFVPEAVGPRVGGAEREGESYDQQPVEVPSWATQAWEILDDDEVLRQSLSAHLEGVAIQADHPTFALIAFIAAIETIGQKLKNPSAARSAS